MKSCSHNDAYVTYNEALKLPEQEYGNPHRNATAYLKKLKNWPTIKSEDGEAMRDLSIFLLTSSNNMDTMNTLNQLNSPTEIMKVVKKLPFDMRKR